MKGQINSQEYLKKANKLRNGRDHYYNCAQSVLVTFAGECGISEEKASQLGTFFGRGMQMGSCCGAITGGLMVLGMMGGGEEQYRSFMNNMRENHNNLVNCSDLLKKNASQGGDMKTHCDNMVYDAVKNVMAAMPDAFQ